MSKTDIQLYLDGKFYYEFADVEAFKDVATLNELRVSSFANNVANTSTGFRHLNVNVFENGYTGDISELFDGTCEYDYCMDIKRFTE